MAEIQNLEFRNMLPGQGKEVCNLVLESIKGKEPYNSPQGQVAFERYISAIEQRGNMGYINELVYVSGVLAGIIETKGPGLISMLYIHPNYINKGLGSRLIARAASRCSKAVPKIKTLTVYATDTAIYFYERAGFIRSGPRKENGGIFSTPYKLPLKTKDQLPSAKLHSSAVEFFVFTGTGNSLIAAKSVAEVLRHENVSVHIHSMDQPCPPNLSVETAIGLIFPVACFSTYPTVWRFIETMPAGEGREVFVLGTMGGACFGMQGPLRKILSKKGYKPVAAKFLIMPSNYNNKIINPEKNAACISKSLIEAQSFAYDLLNGRARWKSGIPLLSSAFYYLGRTRKPWNFFYKIFPISVDESKCTRCGRCASICPANAITMNYIKYSKEKYPAIDGMLCESCQRCIGFCPQKALNVPDKPAEQYRAMSYEDFKSSFE